MRNNEKKVETVLEYRMWHNRTVMRPAHLCILC